MLVDGNSLTYRAFHALPPDLATASGQVTNAVFGFTSMLINLVRDHQPDGIAVTFDLPQPTFRHERTEVYKANREKAPDILREQMGIVRQVVETLRLPLVDLPRYEADDIIATLATQAAAKGLDVLIVTGDRDSYQLVEDPHIKVVYNKRGVSDYALYDEAGILERTGVKPSDYVEYAALRGDNSDNLPGIPGVGEKTAAKLINKYGGIDGIYANVEEQTPKLRENLAANEAQARLNVELMLLVRDAPVGVEVEDLMDPEPYDVAETKKLFDFLEFRTLFERLEATFAVGAKYAGANEAVADDSTELVASIVPVDDDRWHTVFSSGEPVALAPGFDGDTLTGLAIVVDVDAGEVGWAPFPDLPSPVAEMLASSVDRTIEGGPSGFWAHDAKPLLRALISGAEVGQSLMADTSLAAYLLDPGGRTYPLDELLVERTSRRMPSDDGPPEGQLDFGEQSVSPAERAAIEALAVAHVAPSLIEQIVNEEVIELFTEVEVPLVRVLARMEHVGVGIDRSELETLNRDMTAEADMLSKLIQEDAGREFNVNSTKVLREVLFEDLGLTPGKKNKTGYSTDQATLEKLSGEHPIIDHLLRYREVEKLRSTYGAALLAEADADDRIRATFNQTVARTGRLSSEHPNLHNIPVRTEMGRSFRKAFVPAEGTEFLVADYNQIELRCIAHLAKDPGLIEAFTAGTDVHSAVAARVFDVEPEDVTFEQRSKAKMVSYGLAYGMEAYGLGQRLGIKTSEAAMILDSYFEGFPAVRAYMDATVTEARNKGYTETLFGRRRMIPELRSDRTNIRLAGERQAMNAGIQGLAADIFKVALVRLDRALDLAGLESRVVLQVHDEVILEVPPAEKERATKVVLDSLSNAFDLAVPLEINLSFGATWADAKD
jgi:DNA polymerase-1